MNDCQSEVSEEDSAQRERHLKDMRDRIVSAKRAGREEQASKAASESASAAAAAATKGPGGGPAVQPRAGGGTAAIAPTRGRLLFTETCERRIDGCIFCSMGIFFGKR